MSNHGLRPFFLVVLLLLAVASPAFAELADRPCPDAVVLADFWGIAHFLSSGGRARIVQICVVAMCLALFIMMRKLNG